MQKKKKIILSFFAGLFLTTNVFANYPVIDFTAIATAVTHLYTAYDEVNGIISEVQNGVTRIQQAAKAMQNWNWESIGDQWANAWQGGDFNSVWNSLDFRDELNGTLSSLEAYQRNILAIEDVFDKKNIKFKNGASFSVAELLGVEHNDVISALRGDTQDFDQAGNIKKAWSKVLEVGKDDLAKYKALLEPTRYMTEWEKALWDRFHPDQSTVDYLYAQTKGEVVEEGIDNAIKAGIDEAKNLQKQTETFLSDQVLQEVLSNLDQTIPELLQKMSILVVQLNKTLSNMSVTLTGFRSDVANAIMQNMKANGQTISLDANGNPQLIDREEYHTKLDLQNDHDDGYDF